MQFRTLTMNSGYYYLYGKNMSGILYLIPTLLGETTTEQVLPSHNTGIILGLTEFIVEDLRSARRFLKKVDRSIDIDSLTFHVLNEHTKATELGSFTQNLSKGKNVGLLSDAGCPGVADPGADIVAIAHQQNIRVIPLVGPSSILMAMMASGMNGQNFAFVGYLPVKPPERVKRIRQLEKLMMQEDQSQVFIEAPYRNIKLLQDMVNTCHPDTKICVAADITLETEFIQTKTAAQWKNRIPDLHKRPTIFVIGR